MPTNPLVFCEHRVNQLSEILHDTRPRLPSTLQALCTNRVASVVADGDICLSDVTCAGTAAREEMDSPRSIRWRMDCNLAAQHRRFGIYGAFAKDEYHWSMFDEAFACVQRVDEAAPQGWRCCL